MKHFSVAFLGSIVLLAGCAAELAEGEDGPLDDPSFEEEAPELDPIEGASPSGALEEPAATELVYSAPLVVYWGVLRDAAGKVDISATAALVVPNVETVFVTRSDDPNLNPGGGAFNHLRSIGARFAYHLPEEWLMDWMNRKVAAATIGQLLQSWDYVMVDELHGPTASEGDWRDSATQGKQLHAMLSTLHQYPNLRRRVMLSFREGVGAAHVPGTNGDAGMANYLQTMKQCQDQCRIMTFQVYMSTAEVFQGAWTWYETLADRIRRLSPGSNHVSIPVLGLANDPTAPNIFYLNQPNLDLYPWRGTGNGSGWGGLYLQMYASRFGQYARIWPGIAFYTLARLVDRPGYYTRSDAVAVLRYLTDAYY